MIIYYACKKLIEAQRYEYNDMSDKLDMYLLHNRINADEYAELTGIMNAQQSAK